MVLVRADWLPSLFEHAGLFAAAAPGRDRRPGRAGPRAPTSRSGWCGLSGLAPGSPDFIAARAALAALLSSELTSTATLGWAGTSGSLVTFAGQRLLWTAGGAARPARRAGAPRRQPPPVDVPLRGSARLAPLPGCRRRRGSRSRPWFLYLSGGAAAAAREKARPGAPTGSYGAFLGVNPYVTATNLFFGGGLSETFAARQATAPGVNGRGVIAPGLNVELDLGRDVDAAGPGGVAAGRGRRAVGRAHLRHRARPPASWEAAPWLFVGAEVDVLLPGDFFGGGRTISKSVLAVDLRTP